MKFFLDENFPKTAEVWLVARGHTVLDLRGTEHKGADDETIFGMVQDNQCVFLTTDRDFFHTIPHLHPDHHGIVVITLRQPDRQSILNKLSWFLDQFGTESLTGKVFLLRDRAYAVYATGD